MSDDSTADDDPYRVVETSAIEEITQVRLYDSTLEHIAEGHPEIAPVSPSIEGAIADAIARPSAVRRSNTSRHGIAYSYCSERHRLGNNQLVVPVKLHSGTSGYVKTAFFTDSPAGDVVWSEGSD